MTEQERIEAQRRHDAGESWASIAGGDKAAGKRLRKAQAKWRKRRAAGAKAAGSSSVADVSCEGVRVVQAQHAATVEEVADANGLDLREWRCVKVQGKPYQGYMRGDDGEPVIVNLWSRSFVFERMPDALACDLPPCPTYPAPPEHPADSDACALIIPDSQNGYRRDTHGRLDPLHDRRAWDLAVQAAATLRPTCIVMLGDMLDLAPWSCRWPTPLNLRDTTNPARAELRWWIQQLREAAPRARIVWLEGNHEHRISRLLTERAGELGGLVDLETGELMVSIPRIMQMDGLHVEYVAPYGMPWWLWRDSAPVLLHHGHKYGAKGGQSVAKALQDDPVSSIFGHVHRREMAARVVADPRRLHGSREVFALTPGTIARTDGAVPAASPRVDWQQGLGIIRRVDGVAHESLCPIKAGRVIVDGRVLTARDRLPELREALPDWRW